MFHVKHRRLCFTWNFYLDVRFHVERSALLGLARAFHVNLCFERDASCGTPRAEAVCEQQEHVGHVSRETRGIGTLWVVSRGTWNMEQEPGWIGTFHVKPPQNTAILQKISKILEFYVKNIVKALAIQGRVCYNETT